MKIKITFTEPILGTLPGNKDIAEEYITSKHPEGHSEEEIDSLPDTIEKQSTYFARDKDGKPMLWDYQVKGFFKAACLAMIMTDTMTKEELTKYKLTMWGYKRTIDLLVFVNPRRIKLIMPEGSEIKMNERPLRKENFKGGKTALARSEEISEGTVCFIEIIAMNEKLNDFIRRWLDYGALSGLGQWRNASYGRFAWEEIKSE